MGGRALSALGGLVAPTAESQRTSGGGLLPAGHESGPRPAGEGVGAAQGAQPESAVAATRAVGGGPWLLTLIYHWFTEGFDTPDLQAAKALLEALA